jgi:hypothetical protein
MTAVTNGHPETRERWVVALTHFGLFVLVVIGTYWSAAAAIILGTVILVIAGARALSTVRATPEQPPANDQAWAKSTLASSPVMVTAALSLEWLALGAGAFVAVAQPPIQEIATVASITWPVAALTVAFAVASVAWERRKARRILRSTP